MRPNFDPPFVSSTQANQPPSEDAVALTRFMIWAWAEAQNNLRDPYLDTSIQELIEYMKLEYGVCEKEIETEIRSLL